MKPTFKVKKVGVFALLFLISIYLVTILLARSAENKEIEALKIGVVYDAPLSISKNKDLTWEQEKHHFAEQLTRAFGISRDKAYKYAPIILTASIDSLLSEISIASIIMTESSFREDAVSVVGAYGATQIRALYWEDFCKENGANMYQLEGNVECGAKIINFLKEKFCQGDLHCALEHYNVGRTNLKSSAWYRSAGKRYTKKINKYATKLASTAGNNLLDNHETSRPYSSISTIQ